MSITQSRQGAKLSENELSKIVVDAAYHLHKDLGPGLLETVYEVLLAHSLNARGLQVERQVPVPILYDGVKFDQGFRADLIVERKVLLELKSVEKPNPVHLKQLLTYLKLTNMKLGILINFGVPLIKDGLKRVVNDLKE